MAIEPSNTHDDLTRRFRGQLPHRMQQIGILFNSLSPDNGQNNWDMAAVSKLHREIHGIAGSAATFGLPLISETARELETMLADILNADLMPSQASWEAANNVFNRLNAVKDLEKDTVAFGVKAPKARKLAEGAPLVFIVDDDLDVGEDLSNYLLDQGFRVEVFSELEDFKAIVEDAKRPNPDVVIIDLIFPEGKDAGALSASELGLAKSLEIPVIVMSVRDDLEGRLAAFRAGAVRYMTKPIDKPHLSAFLDQVTNRLPAEPFRILIVDDEPILLELHAEILRGCGMEVVALSEPLEFIKTLDQFDADVIILDVYMPDASGPELAAVVREREKYLHTPILFLSAESDVNIQLQALNLGGDDFLIKPILGEHLIATVSARARRSRAACAIRDRLELELYEREREHFALNQHGIVSVADRGGLITYVNEKFCEISGYKHHELLGKNHRIVKSDVHPPEFYKEMWTTISGGSVWRGEICNKRKDGSLYWVDSTITPFLDGQGVPYQFVSIRVDITIQKEAQIELAIEKERLRRGQLFANLGTWDWNIQTGELFWSERIAALFGYAEGELETSYDNFMGAIHPEDRDAVSNAVTACVEGEAPYVIEHRVVWPDGTVRWLLERGAIERDKNGAPLRMLGVVQDIDDRKRAELTLVDREQQLREAQSLAHLGNWWADKNTGTLKWSGEVYSIFGYDPNDFQPSVDAFLQSVHPDDLELVRKQEENALKTGHLDYVHRIVRPNGDVRHVREIANTDVDEFGSPIFLVGTVQDVTGQVEAQQALIAARDEAERANRTKSDFLSSMSHELRTPMNAILGFGQLLEIDDEMSAESLDSVHEILKAGKHLLQLINEVLDLSKIESGKLDMSIEDVELKGVVDECLAILMPIANKAGIGISSGIADDIILRADRMRLKQILLNLLSNAIKYNRTKGSVSLRAIERQGGRYRIQVTDTGYGIADDRLQELFEPFNRLDAEATEIEGTGIGLTIARRITEIMQGVMGVESEVGVGSTFWIELPVATSTVGESVDNVDETTLKPLDQDSEQKYSMLYIEDNPVNLKLVASILRNLGNIELRMAETPELGVEMAMANRPDLILLDINMPNLNGYQVLDIFKENQGLSSVPVIAMTANAMPHDIERGLEAGFSDYIVKPIDIKTFLQVVMGHLNHLEVPSDAAAKKV